MNAIDKIDAARIELMLGELRLPGIKMIWAALGGDGRQGGLGLPPASWPRSASRRSWSGIVGASNAIGRKPDCRRERPWTPSTSPPCR